MTDLRVTESLRGEPELKPDFATGVVYLVGGGPGDAGLITAKAGRLLRDADVVVYDRLVSPQLLALPKPTAELVYVGKEKGHHEVPQEAIERLLIRHAKLGRKVVRLKGGDPLVFGRGGEEALSLREAGVRFEFVPGVTSATAVPAYAGIPVTHRQVATSFHVVTGHECVSRENSQVDWSLLANQSTTVVVLMGMSHLNVIARNLVEAGRSEETPVAIVVSGSRTNQQTEVGTLGEFARRGPRDATKLPGLIVIGDVVSLRQTLAWVEDKPRFGERILVLSELESEARQHALRYEDEGAEALALSLESFSLPDLAVIDEIQDQLLTTTTNVTCAFKHVIDAVHFFTRLRDREVDLRRLAHVQFLASEERVQRVIMGFGLNSRLADADGFATSDSIRAEKLFRMGPLLSRMERILHGFRPEDWMLAPESVRALYTLTTSSETAGQGFLDNMFRFRKDIGA